MEPDNVYTNIPEVHPSVVKSRFNIILNNQLEDLTQIFHLLLLGAIMQKQKQMLLEMKKNNNNKLQLKV